MASHAMCDNSKLAEQLFTSIPALKKGPRVYVVASMNSVESHIAIKSILYCGASDTPQEALEDFCKAMGLDSAIRICLPVVLPEVMRQGDVKGFKAVCNGAGNLYIEFTS